MTADILPYAAAVIAVVTLLQAFYIFAIRNVREDNRTLKEDQRVLWERHNKVTAELNKLHALMLKDYVTFERMTQHVTPQLDSLKTQFSRMENKLDRVLESRV